jgi:hypothetical protein
VHYDVVAEHNSHVGSNTSMRYTNISASTAYTGVAEVEPGVLLLAYDHYIIEQPSTLVGDVMQVFAMRISIN